MNHKKDIKMCQRRVTKKKSLSSDKGLLRYGTFKRVKIVTFQVLNLSSPLSELYEIFLGDSPMTLLNFLFMVHIREPHQI